MTYRVVVDPQLQKKLEKLFKKDRKTYEHLKKKLVELSSNPEIGKPLRNVLKNNRRLHIGSFVLVYKFNKEGNTITLLEFEHHDKVYK